MSTPQDANAIQDELSAIESAGLLRKLRTLDPKAHQIVQFDGRAVLNFSSNDYLGLAQSEALKKAMIEGVQRYGTGSGASRLVCGSITAHGELEETLAAFKG